MHVSLPEKTQPAVNKQCKSQPSHLWRAVRVGQRLEDYGLQGHRQPSRELAAAQDAGEHQVIVRPRHQLQVCVSRVSRLNSR